MRNLVLRFGDVLDAGGRSHIKVMFLSWIGEDHCFTGMVLDDPTERSAPFEVRRDCLIEGPDWQLIEAVPE